MSKVFQQRYQAFAIRSAAIMFALSMSACVKTLPHSQVGAVPRDTALAWNRGVAPVETVARTRPVTIKAAAIKEAKPRRNPARHWALFRD